MKIAKSAVALALLSAFLALPGCTATPQQNARHVVDVAAIAVDLTDQVFAQQYTARARVALAAAHDMAEYRAAVAPLDAVVQALEAAHAALQLGDAAIRVWDTQAGQGWPHAQECIVGALVGLRDLLVAAGVPVPSELSALLDGVHAVVDTDLCFGDA